MWMCHAGSLQKIMPHVNYSPDTGITKKIKIISRWAWRGRPVDGSSPDERFQTLQTICAVGVPECGELASPR
jgi:hypothetical protein